MIESISLKIAQNIKNKAPYNTVSIEVMKFALIGLTNAIITIIVSLLISIPLGNFLEVSISMITFAIIRGVSGGYHFNSALVCTVFSAIIFNAVPFFTLSEYQIGVLTILSVFFMLIFAPLDMEKHSRVPKKYYMHLKIASIGIIVCSYFIQSDVITISIAIQSFSLLLGVRKILKGGEQL
ncbi:accessory gene regulator ArgB-like protein [Chengkuizengella marina]|uniref:Accessory gene regulator B n=1 Tax=Chengkuizengella marina TaxID=2507566 RepID=A0A6N9Q120_9BACL|nr:accessory gene regulator B family protein [Chengkuizengella marina]NBI28655.1 hypothetical protein [Chengkuizengella marina]